jgi:alpha-1,6-mannosyltransferase
MRAQGQLESAVKDVPALGATRASGATRLADRARRFDRPATFRYAGLAGTVLLAVAALTATAHKQISEPTWLAGSLLLGGAFVLLGRRLDGIGLRWLLVTAALWALPLLLSFPLESRDVYAYACQGTLVTHGVDPYTHGVADLPCPWLSHVPKVWRHSTSPYGPLWLVLIGGAAATGKLTLAIVVLRVLAVAGVVLTGWVGHRLATTLGTDPVRGAWLALAGPVTLVHGLAGGHNDALLAGIVLGSILLAVGTPGGRWASAQAVGAGAVLGLGVAVKASALVALPFLALLVTSERRWWPVIRAGLLATLGLVGTYGLLWAATGYGLGWIPALQTTTKFVVEWTSIPTGVGMGIAHALKLAGFVEASHHAVDWVRWVGMAALAALVVALWLWARRRTGPHATVLATGVALLLSVVLGPVAFPWYALVPLAILAYGLTDDRWRYRVGLLCAPVLLLILPNGNGLAPLYKTFGFAVDSVIVLGAIGYGLYRLRARLRRAR